MASYMEAWAEHGWGVGVTSSCSVDGGVGILGKGATVSFCGLARSGLAIDMGDGLRGVES